MKKWFIGFAVIVFGCDKPVPNPPGDPYIKIRIGDVSKAEGTGGTTPFEFSVTLDKASTQQVTMQYSTEEGTAKNDDYTTASGTLTFNPGETSKSLTVNVIGDDGREGDEQFTLKLSNNNIGIIEKSSGIGLISNDDAKVKFTNAGYDAPTSYAGYSLVWADEFNGNSLDESTWSYDIGDGCPALCGWGNNELEYYTKRPENIFFQDGKLLIEARAESFSGKNYTSAKIHTRDKKTIKYGRIDVRAKLPRGKGIWPAIWMMPQSSVYGGWPRSGEIDIMEYLGHETNKAYGTIHFGPGPGSTQISKPYILPSGTFYDEFHVFTLEWKQDQLKWYVDNNLFLTVNKADLGTNNYPFNEQFFLILNLAIGGNWPGNPDAGTSFPQWLIVDYVRLYQ